MSKINAYEVMAKLGFSDEPFFKAEGFHDCHWLMIETRVPLSSLLRINFKMPNDKTIYVQEVDGKEAVISFANDC